MEKTPIVKITLVSAFRSLKLLVLKLSKAILMKLSYVDRYPIGFKYFHIEYLFKLSY